MIHDAEGKVDFEEVVTKDDHIPQTTGHGHLQTSDYEASIHGYDFAEFHWKRSV